MGVRQAPFELNRLSSTIEQERCGRGLTWTQLSKEVGVAGSTIRRFATATDAEADGVLVMVHWLGVAPEHFINNSTVEGAPLPASDHGVHRVDMELLSALPSWSGATRVAGRTTIQRLAHAAQSSGVAIASLTRLSPI